MGGGISKMCTREEEPFFLPEDHPEVIARQEKMGVKKKKSVKLCSVEIYRTSGLSSRSKCMTP